MEGMGLSGEVEIDGAYFGGKVRPANHKENRKDRRKAENQNGERRVVIALRERDGATKTFVAEREADGVALAVKHIASDATVYADEALHWDALARQKSIGSMRSRRSSLRPFRMLRRRRPSAPRVSWGPWSVSIAWHSPHSSPRLKSRDVSV